MNTAAAAAAAGRYTTQPMPGAMHMTLQPSGVPLAPMMMMNQPYSQTLPNYSNSNNNNNMMMPMQLSSAVNIPSSNTIDPSVFNDLVKNEMITVLHQIFAGMDTNDCTLPITLDELRIENPDLYSQIQLQAQENAQQMLMQQMRTTTSASSSLGANMNNNNNNNNNNNSQQQNMAMMISNNDTLQQQQLSHLRKRPHEEMSTNINRGKGNHHSAFQQQQIRSLLPSSISSSTSKPLSFVNGYISETMVALDVDRLITLAPLLQQQHQHDLAMMMVGGSPISTVTAEQFQQITKKLGLRLQQYIHDIMIPPALPMFFQPPGKHPPHTLHIII
jgi:hypothetical protein